MRLFSHCAAWGVCLGTSVPTYVCGEIEKFLHPCVICARDGAERGFCVCCW